MLWYEQPPPEREADRAGRRACRARGRGARAVRRRAERAGHDRRRAAVRLRARARARASWWARSAALASNLFLGQGPWTPWQMVGWGAAGLRRRAARVGSPAAAWAAGRWRSRAALAGLAFGAWMDLFTLTSFAAQTVRRRVRRDRGAVAAVQHRARDRQRRSVPRVRALRSCASWSASAAGSHVRWVPARSGDVRAAPRRSDAARRCASRSRPSTARGRARARCATACGIWSAHRTTTAASAARRGQASSQLVTGWTVLGLEAAGRHPLDVRRGGRTPIDFIRGGRRLADGDRRAGAHDPRAARRRASTRGASAGATCSPTSSASAARTDRSRASSNWTAFGIMSLRACGRSAALGGGAPRGRLACAPAERRRRLLVRDPRRRQLRRRDRRRAAGPGRRRPAPAAARSTRALSYLRKAQNPDGGFGQTEGYRSNAQSTAWAVQGIVAAGRAPAVVPPRRAARRCATWPRCSRTTAASATRARAPRRPVWVTAQVVAALRRKAFPVREPRAPAGDATDRRAARRREARAPRRVTEQALAAPSAARDTPGRRAEPRRARRRRTRLRPRAGRTTPALPAPRPDRRRHRRRGAARRLRCCAGGARRRPSETARLFGLREDARGPPHLRYSEPHDLARRRARRRCSASGSTSS